MRFLLMGLIMLGALHSAEGVEIAGHRGASYDAPENTLASVELAWRQGAEAVEVDVRLSRDGRIVVIHDADTKRVGGRDRKVADQTLEELRTIDVGRWKAERWAGERMPLLEDVLATIPPGKRLFIEVKCGDEIVPELVRVLGASGKSADQTAVIGFELPVMQAARQALPGRKVYWIVGLKQDKQTGRWTPGADELIARATAARMDGLHLSAGPAIDRSFVEQVHGAGLALHLWTVNSEEVARRAAEDGVDGITTDRPGWLRERLEGDAEQ